MAGSSNSAGMPQRIIKGPEIPLVIGGIREKTEKEYIDADWKKISANAKTLNILHCALNVIEYNHVSCYESAKEVWDKLEVTYKGTNQVKKSKVNLLIRDFEMFEIKPSETIVEMCTRFTDLMNLLKALSKTKITVIFDTIDFTRYTHNELIRLLIVNEMMFKKEITEKEKGKKGIALKLEKLTDGKNKYIALKIDISESSNLSSDEEIAINKYKIFIKKYGPKDDSQSYPHKDPKEVICYEYNKLGHIRPNCPKSKKTKKEDKGKKAMAAFIESLIEKVLIVEESINVVFDESNPVVQKKDLCEVDFEQIFSEQKIDEKTKLVSKPKNQFIIGIK
ncbi:hypothetical protein MANES_16G049670v8 [Manihot esculenta]|uniref:Uncharacterized protein n=1 Tax=Manihot esculenta TaxID=3983 RepID=A0ACB7G5W1_MANES|nr:hypothetical protein MANES_16G049670v8 [Manihot esculenta]